MEYTDSGQLQWSIKGSSDFVTTIDGYRVEIERLDKGEKRKADTIIVYLWDKESNIVDSSHAYEGTEGWMTYLRYLAIVRKNASQVPEILSNILSKLKNP
jgi:hypothetical protein